MNKLSEIKIGKCPHRGWRAECWAGHLNGKNSLNIVALKRSNGNLEISLSGGTLNRGMFSFAPFSDFRSTPVSVKIAKVTQNSVKQVIEAYLKSEQFKEDLEKFEKFYGEKQ